MPLSPDARRFLRVALAFLGALTVLASMALILFLAGQYRPLDNSDLQIIDVPNRVEGELPRVPLSDNGVAVIGSKCIKGHEKVWVVGEGVTWTVIGPISGVVHREPGGTTELDPDDPERVNGCLVQEFLNTPLPSPIAEQVKRQGAVIVVISGKVTPDVPLSLNPLNWHWDTGQPGFFPVSSTWRTEPFVIYDDSPNAKEGTV